MFTERIQQGFDVFVHEGDKAVGAVREVHRGQIVIYVENAGDFVVPLHAISDVHSEKVTLNCAKLDMTLKRAIGHAHAAEDPKI